MTKVHDAVALAQAEERLRQERETFDQKKAQDKKVFVLRLAMGWTAVLGMVVICGFSGYVIADHSAFPHGAVVAATSALLVEAFALIGAVWRLILGKGPKDLAPLTAAAIIEGDNAG